MSSDIDDISKTYADKPDSVKGEELLTRLGERMVRRNLEQKQGIETRRFFYPLHRQPFYKAKGGFPNSNWAFKHGLSLPSYPSLKQKEIEYVCSKVNKCSRKH